MAIEEFSRDLGYLDKFLDKLDAQASSLTGGDAERLRALMKEERSRWAEIRQILAGGGAPTPVVEEKADPAVEEAPAPVGEAPFFGFGEHPYTRALRVGMAMLPRGQAPSAEKPAATSPQRKTPGLTVGSLRQRG